MISSSIGVCSGTLPVHVLNARDGAVHPFESGLTGSIPPEGEHRVDGVRASGRRLSDADERGGTH